MLAFKKIALAGTAFTMILAAFPAQAQQKTANHTMGSGDEIWRIELRNLENFLATSVDDSDGVDELRHIRTGDQVSLDRLGPARGITDTYNLWVHARERPQTGFGITTPNFEIPVEARELDCFRDRVCSRGSTGTITYFVTLDVPTGTANRCSADNSYQISAAGGPQMVLTPMSTTGGGSGRVTVNARLENSGGHTISLGARGQGSRMELAMQGGQVCIAWTGRRG